MADVGTRLVKLHPEIEIGVDFRFDDATGEILDWNEDVLGPKPADIYELDEQTKDVELEVEKEYKKQEIAKAAIEEISSVYTSGVDGKDEFDYEIAKAVIAIGEALGIQQITNNQKLREVVRCGSKGREIQAIIENAETIEEVQQVEWTDG